MFGAILGDIVGSPYEYGLSGKTKEFPLFVPQSGFTDDTVMTIAVADAFMKIDSDANDNEIRKQLIASMQFYGNLFPRAGYGGMFLRWLNMDDPQPYGSYGNGAAMRVSSAGWLFGDLETVRRMARLSAEVSHNHREGIKGAEAVASVIYLAKTGHSKEEIREFVERVIDYGLVFTCDEIRPNYEFDVTCQGTVPEAITAFLEGESFIDVIRTAVSLGGDCDTLTCIAGSMAEAFYEVPEELKKEVHNRLPKDLDDVLVRFVKRCSD